MTTSAGRSSRSPRLRPDRRMRIHGRRGWLVTFGLVAGGLVVATTPAVPALAGGQVCAGVVIDGAGGAPLTQGASVPPGSSDLDLLNAAGDSVTQNDSGLVCVINGYPVNGLQNCLKAAHGLYYFWSYWEGDPATNTWTYAAVGPAEHTVAAGQSYVEGWRYQDPGPASPAAAKPSVTPTAAFAQACRSVPPTTTTTTGVGRAGPGLLRRRPPRSLRRTRHGHASAARRRIWRWDENARCGRPGRCSGDDHDAGSRWTIPAQCCRRSIHLSAVDVRRRDTSKTDAVLRARPRRSRSSPRSGEKSHAADRHRGACHRDVGRYGVAQMAAKADGRVSRQGSPQPMVVGARAPSNSAMLAR